MARKSNSKNQLPVFQSFVILSQGFVIQSGVTASQGEAVAQSKDPYELLIPRDTCGPTFLQLH
jgi:hypothetical protein